MILIPNTVWRLALDIFGSAENPEVEQVVFLDGVETPDVSVVTTLTVPNARLRVGAYDISAAAMSEAGKHLRRFRLLRLAQVHTHPGVWVGHSSKDCLRAYSQVPGALSIVVPNGGEDRSALQDCGVHLRTAHGWKQLTPAERDTIVSVVPSFFDFRRAP